MARRSTHHDLIPTLRVVRIGFVGLLILLTMLYVISVGTQPAGELEESLAIDWWIPVLAALVLAAVFLAVDLFTPIKRISVISGVVFGLVAGLIAAWALSSVLDLVIATWDLQKWESAEAPIFPVIKVLLGVSLSFLGISTVLQTQDEFRLIIPYVEFAKQIRGMRPLLLDTSTLIDGRISDLGATGLIQQPVLVPAFVLEELQALSDSQDRTKREHGRRGLDMVTRLQRQPSIDAAIDNTPVTKMAVDQMLIELASQLPATILTTDSGLQRVATIQAVSVVNINELAEALKPGAIPGQKVTIRLVRKGEQPGQAVGFRDDGTMVIAEDGEPMIGDTVEVTLTSSTKTSAGRLLFARVGDEPIEPVSNGAVEPVEDPEPIEADPKPAAAPRSPRPAAGPSRRNPRR